MSTKALILVGGGTRGTRFRPISLDTPKVLFPVAGKPMLSHAIDAVATLPSVKEIILFGFYEEYVFRDFIHDTVRQYPHLSIKYLREYKAMGTAGGLYHFRDEILKGSPQHFYVIHADVCSSFPLKELATFFEEKKAKAVILGTRVPAKIANNFGAIVADEDQKVVHYVEKPESHISTLINAGVYLFDKSFFQVMKEARQKKVQDANDHVYFSEDQNDQDILRLEQDVLVKFAEREELYVYETKDFWRQVKEAGSAVAVNSLYLQQLFQSNPKAPGLAAPSANIVPPVFIDPLAEVDVSAKLGPDVSIGPHAKIGKGARIKDSIILEHAQVKDNGVVLHSILCSGTKVGQWSRVEGSPNNHNTYTATTEKDGVRMQTVSILATNVSVADEVHVQNTIVLPHKEIKNDVKNEVIM
ncbi:mannose-1-phosphate guanylyltransferase [Sugiyamaella lignohabitans]|uniref:mannose-1-phosphate guanylyltransferase n=1 Tax=Sugiyamaella lignohabitans TaxID=796027 RepID=A0A161HH23_9ASCO|nr:mannose-1-phosphate guanylyltransferase [Sugiyamaella lignohabitans]ANB11257.1 mannose-1-phosphate guanylyltransferase [Sugiyamaella lignohabitans]